MQKTGFARLKALAAALVVAISLSGCTIPIVNVEIPIDMPDLSALKLPELHFSGIDFSNFGIKPITLPIGVRTSVDEAREQVLKGNASTLDDSALVKPGYLSVGVKTILSSAPMCMEGDSGSLYGMDIDLAAALASEMGLKVRYVPVVDSSTMGSSCDIIMNGRSNNYEQIAIVGSYVESATSFFYRGDPTVAAATDLGGKTVGLQSGSVSEMVLGDTKLKMSQKTYGNLNEAFNALEIGEIDYVLCEAYPGGYLASLRNGISFAGTLEAPEPSGVAVLASNDALVSGVQAAFDTVSMSGVLQGIRSRWVGTLPSLTTDSQIKDVPKAD